MDYEKMVEEALRLYQKAAATEPTDDNYEKILGLCLKQVKAIIDYNEACDKQNERQERLDMEKEKNQWDYEIRMKELELKLEELVMKREIEQNRIDENEREAVERRRAEKRQAKWELLKIVLQIIGCAVCVVVTGKIEQNVIIGQHKWGWIPKLGKF